MQGESVELRQALIALGALLPAAAFAQVERFAVVVGNDVGQPPDVALAYAETDAARMAGVLQEVGGVRPENLVLLRGQDAARARSSSPPARRPRTARSPTRSRAASSPTRWSRGCSARPTKTATGASRWRRPIATRTRPRCARRAGRWRVCSIPPFNTRCAGR